MSGLPRKSRLSTRQQLDQRPSRKASAERVAAAFAATGARAAADALEELLPLAPRGRRPAV